MKKIAIVIYILNALNAYVNASACADLDRENIAAQKIQILFQNHLVGNLIDTAKNERSKIKNDRFLNVEANEHYFKIVQMLNDGSALKEITIATVFCLADGKQTAMSMNLRANLKQYLKSQIGCQNKMRRHICKMWFSTYIFSDYKETSDLFEEMMISGCARLRAVLYQHLACMLGDSGNIEQARDMYLRGISLPKQYHADTYLQLAELYRDSCYPISLRKFYLKRVIKVGTLEKQAGGRYKLAALYTNKQNSEIYDPEYALNLYQTFLQDQNIIYFIDPFRIYLDILGIITQDWLSNKHYNLNYALEICENIYSDRKKITPNYYWDILTQMIKIYPCRSKSMDADYLVRSQRMLDISEAILNEPLIPIKCIRQININMANEYTHGPVDICDYKKALDILTKLRIDLAEPYKDETTQHSDAAECSEYYEDIEYYEDSIFMEELEREIEHVKWLIGKDKNRGW